MDRLGLAADDQGALAEDGGQIGYRVEYAVRRFVEDQGAAVIAQCLQRLPALAVLDVAELYRLKELQVAAVLVKRDASDEERAGALRRAAGFGTEVSTLLQALPGECRCIVLARGAVMGSEPLLRDLTPDVRRRLGL